MAPADGGPKTVLLVDAQRAFGQALWFVLDRSDRLGCIGLLTDRDELAATVQGRRPDVVLLDADLLGDDARDLRAVVEPAALVVLGRRLDATLFARAAEAGAAAVAARDRDLRVLLRALDGPGDGRFHVEAGELASIAERVEDDPAAVGLTPRELEVLGLLGQGLVPRAIAERLSIGLHTARGHVKSILAKLDAHSALEAVARAREQGLF
jgi:DNA-binding NarL/FixJ family response regulator